MVARVLAVLAVVSMAGVCLAHDHANWIPPWRGTDRSQRSLWEDWGGFPGDMPADQSSGGVDNGIPLWQPRAVGLTSEVSRLDSYHNRNGVLKVSANKDFPLYFRIDDWDSAWPNKDIWIQIDYYRYAGPMEWKVTGNSPGGSTSTTFSGVPVSSTEPDADGWCSAWYQFSIQPNPYDETISVRFMVESYIDQVVIDTRCVPEPASLLLLAAGGLALLRKK